MINLNTNHAIIINNPSFELNNQALVSLKFKLTPGFIEFKLTMSVSNI